MISYAKRAMELEELREVERISGDARGSRGCLIAAMAFSVLGWGAIGALVAGFVGWNVAPSQWVQFGGTGFVVGAALMGLLLWVRPQTSLSLIGVDRHEGEVELVHVHAFGVARVPIGFFFDVGEGNLLFLRGPYLHAAVRSALFPNRYFTLVRLPLSKRIIRILCHGEPITSPSAPPGPEVDLEALPDGAILPARLETVRQDVAALLASGWKPA